MKRGILFFLLENYVVCSKNREQTDMFTFVGSKNMWLNVQASVTSRKGPLVNSKAGRSVSGSSVSRVSRIPALLKSVSKLSSAKTPQSSRKRRSCGNHKMKNPVSSVKMVF